MKVLVTGGRDYADATLVGLALNGLAREHGEITIIEGGATGADALARQWAIRRSLPCITVLADWATHGKAAGPWCNQLMLDRHKPDLVLAFPGGRGTADMVRRARAAGVPVKEVG